MATKPEIILNVKAKEDMAPGAYANMARLQSGEHDTVLDFIMVDHSTVNGDNATAYLVARVIVANTHLPQVSQAIQDHLARIASSKS